MVNLTCANCGILFGLTDERHTRLRETGEAFYCPNGHGNVFRPSELEKARKRITFLEGRANEVQMERDRIHERLIVAVRRENTLRGWITRLKKRSPNRP